MHFAERAHRVLEVGCGTGRVVSALAQHCPSLYLLGIERESERAAYARAHIRALNVGILSGDFLQCAIEERFDLILFAFNVISEFVTPDARIEALKKARSLLNSSGRIVVVQAMHDFEKWSARVTRPSKEITVPGIGVVHVEFECNRDQVNQISECHVVYRDVHGQIVATEDYRVALVTRNELLTAYVAAGLNMCKEFGSLELEPLGPRGDNLVHVLMK
jgi:SAM-dependent methyltransferase